MKSFLAKIILTTSLFWTVFIFSQEHELAKEYFKNAEYAKAEELYKGLFEQNPNQLQYMDYYIQSLQAQEKFDEVETFLTQQLLSNERSAKNNKGFAHVLLGNYYFVNGQEDLAKVSFEKGMEFLKENPSKGYLIAKKYHEVQQLDYALESYRFMMNTYPSSNYYMQIATIYGEKGEIEQMFDTYLDMVRIHQNDPKNVQRYLARYLNDDNYNENNVILRRLLVKRIQESPEIQWYKMLSWLYLLQHDYGKALRQEMAIYSQGFADLQGVGDTGILAYENEQYEVCFEAFDYILGESLDLEAQMQAYYYILESKKQLEKTEMVQKAFDDFFEKYPPSKLNIPVQQSYADFLAFYINKPLESIKVIEKALEKPLGRFAEAELKLQLGDILVYNEQYNKALILYTQVQNILQNHPLGQEARFKVARTSYFKGDFDWANTQLKVLKSGTSKLIANDAMDLSLLISENTTQDSIQVALQTYAAADLLSFQNKTQKAIDSLEVILKNHEGNPIEDEALFKQAKLYEKQGDYEQAIANCEQILTINLNDILYDDAVYTIAVLYDKKLDNPEKAKEYYEKIVLEYPSSIYLVEARKRYRKLRGDEVVP